MFGLGVFANPYWFISYPATITYSCWLRHFPSLDKEGYLFIFFTIAFLSATVWVFSLPISHGMHLVVPAHSCFFWVVCHLNRTFPPKEPEREPQNRLSPLSIARPYPLLPLTYDPPPTTFCIGWVQVGDVWALCVLYFWVRPKLVRCLCICHGLKAHLCVLPLILDLLWRELLSDFYSLSLALLQGLGLAQSWIFPSWAHSLLFLQSCCHFLPCPFAVPAVVLFDLCLLGLFGSIVYSSPNDSMWSLVSYSCHFGLFLAHFIAYRFFCPISFFLSILDPFTSLGHPQPNF